MNPQAIRDQVAIVGMGCSKFGENWDKDPQDMIVEAAYEAFGARRYEDVTLAEVAARERLWLHLDAAYAGSAALAPSLRFVLDGAEHADSIVVNPHKWLFTPIDLSAMFTRRPDVLKRAFSLVPEYLVTREQSDVVNLMDYGVQLGRRFRALKLWMVIRAFGADGLAARLRQQMEMARDLAGWVDADVEEGISSMVGSTEVPCCCRASRRGEIKRPGTIVMTNMNVLMANLTILDFRSALGLNNIDKSPRSNQAGLLSSTSHGYLQCRSENLVCTFFSSSGFEWSYRPAFAQPTQRGCVRYSI